MITKTSSSLAVVALVGALALTGCTAGTAPEVGPEKTAHSVSPTPSPERTFAPGDIVDTAHAEAINADQSDTTVAYPVGDSFVVVTWGKPIPPAVREAVNTNVRAAAPEWGTSTDHGSVAPIGRRCARRCRLSRPNSAGSR